MPVRDHPLDYFLRFFESRASALKRLPIATFEVKALTKIKNDMVNYENLLNRVLNEVPDLPRDLRTRIIIETDAKIG
jgi:hypothetical protein